MSERPFFIIHPAALEEAEKATRWYRKRSAGAAAQFVEEVNHAIDSILDAPHRTAGPPARMLPANSCYIDSLSRSFTVNYPPLSKFWPLLMAIGAPATGKPESKGWLPELVSNSARRTQRKRTALTREDPLDGFEPVE
jgi:plasmid stabilization system protein ParE